MKVFYNSSSLLLAGLFMAGLQACTKVEPVPNVKATTTKSDLTIVSHRYKSQTTGIETTYMPSLYKSSKKATGTPTSQLYDADCVEVYETVYTEGPSGESVGTETVIAIYCPSGSNVPGDIPPGDPEGPNANPNELSPCPANYILSTSAPHSALVTQLRSTLTQSQATGYAYLTYRNGANLSTIATILSPGPNQQEVALDHPFYPGTNQLAPLDGIMSTHTTGMLSIYSVKDLYTFYAAKSTSPWVSDPGMFVSELYTAAGTAYTISCPDGYFFSLFANRYLSTPAGLNDLEALYMQYGITTNNNSNPAANELAFLKLMRDLNSGIFLSKPDPYLPGYWQRVDLGPNNIISPRPCF
jgi:hypothetical protein